MKMRPTEVHLGASKPFFLNKNDYCWMVASGEVEVYYVKTDKEGNLKSARNYLYTATKGEMLFSLKIGDEFDDFSLIAVSPKCKLIEIHKSILGRVNKDQLSPKIASWVNALARYVHQENAPKVFQDLTTLHEAVTLKNKAVGYPAKELYWLKLNEGQLQTFGDQETTITAEEAKRLWLPVSKELWIQSLEAKTNVTLIETRDLVEDDISMMLSIHHLQKYFLRKLKERFDSSVNAASKRIAERMTNDLAAIERGLASLKSIVSDDKQEAAFQDVSTSNHLLAACQLVGKAAGFTFIEPAYIRDYEHNLTGQLTAISQSSNVRTRKVILRGKWWEEENGHLLAFTREDKEPVALIQTASGEYHMKNAASRTSVKVTEEIAHSLDPVAYMFLYAFSEKMSSIKKIGRFAIKGLQVDASFIIMAALAGSLIGLLTPILSGILFDDVIPQADRSFLWEVFAIMLVIAVVKTLLELVKGILLLRVETKSNISVQAGLMDHLLRLPVTFFRRFSAGDLTSRALGINAIRQMLSNTVLTAVLSGTFSIVNLFLLFYYDASLAWVGVGLAVLAVFIISLLGFAKLRYDRQLADYEGSIQGSLFEFLSGINKIRITGAEKRIFSLWANDFSAYKGLSFKSGNYQNFVEVFKASYPLMTNIFFFSFIFMALQSAEGAAGLISVGVFMAFLSAFNQFLGDCLSMSMALISSLNIVPLYERVRPILEEEPESTGDSSDPGELAGEIEFNAVNFRYDPEQPLVLKDVSFKIKAGEMVAFVGPSGSGKSTVMRLLLGFDEPEAGSIYYDGQAYDSLNKELVRRQLGVVLQNGSLMPGSIYKNIVGSSELTLEDAEAAARMAGLEEDIAQMPMGMHTVISEGGSTFSGGQRQRLMIARAIVHKPRIMYMDEATSALDNRTQSIVSESLDRLQATRIVIAHRLSTIVNADRIFVMDQGVIVESGTYQELLEKEGLFSNLAKRQIA